MMKKIAIVLLTVFCVTGCSENPVNQRFLPLEPEKHGGIVYDKETGVMYWMSNGLFNAGELTLIVDTDGKPLIHKGN